MPIQIAASFTVPFGGRRQPLQVVVHCDEDDRFAREFVRQFRQVVKQIPQRDRDAMSRHWVRNAPLAAKITGPSDPRIPFVSLSRTDQMWIDDKPYRGWDGICIARGIPMAFNAEALRERRRRYIREVIAHEFAHALQGAYGWRFETKRAAEEDAYRIAQRWGFDPYGILPEIPSEAVLSRWPRE